MSKYNPNISPRHKSFLRTKKQHRCIPSIRWTTILNENQHPHALFPRYITRWKPIYLIAWHAPRNTTDVILHPRDRWFRNASPKQTTCDRTKALLCHWRHRLKVLSYLTSEETLLDGFCMTDSRHDLEIFSCDSKFNCWRSPIRIAVMTRLYRRKDKGGFQAFLGGDIART